MGFHAPIYFIDIMNFEFPSFIYDLGVMCDLSFDKESKEYNACDFTIDNKKIKYRSAKTTPTKTGKFVTLWKRSAEGSVIPHDLDDEFDQVIITYSNSEYFSFPKSELAKHGIISNQSAEGKRAFRIYSPDLKNLNKQATKTQKWQMSFYYTYN